MKINVFFVHGFISTISATVVAKNHCPNDINILFVERMENMFSTDYYHINELFENYFEWANVVHISRRELLSLTKKRLFDYIKGINYYKSFKTLVKNSLSEYGTVDNIYTCMPMKCWSFASTGKSNINIIEHGMSEYNLLETVLNGNDGSKFLKFYKKMLCSVLRYRIVCENELVPNKFIFTDGNKSEVVNKYRNNSRIPVISINSGELIRNLFGFVEKEYAKKYAEEYDEIVDLKHQMDAYANRYIYLPMYLVPLGDYQDYLDEQSKDVSINDACILIKPHYYSRNDVSRCFEKYTCKVLSLKKDMNKVIPVELLSFMLGLPPIWSDFSSALLYSRWWLNSKPILSEVKSNKINDCLVKEYKTQINDFRKLKTLLLNREKM